MQILRREAAAVKVGLSLSSFLKLTKAPGFPQPVSAFSGIIGWRDTELDAWIAALPPVAPKCPDPPPKRTRRMTKTALVTTR